MGHNKSTMLKCRSLNPLGARNSFNVFYCARSATSGNPLQVLFHLNTAIGPNYENHLYQSEQTRGESIVMTQTMTQQTEPPSPPPSPARPSQPRPEATAPAGTGAAICVTRSELSENSDRRVQQ